jgi:hypothetical protein
VARNGSFHRPRLPVAEVVERQFARSVEAGHGDEDMAAVFARAAAGDAGVTD